MDMICVLCYQEPFCFLKGSDVLHVKQIVAYGVAVISPCGAKSEIL